MCARVRHSERCALWARLVGGGLPQHPQPFDPAAPVQPGLPLGVNSVSQIFRAFPAPPTLTQEQWLGWQGRHWPPGAVEGWSQLEGPARQAGAGLGGPSGAHTLEVWRRGWDLMGCAARGLVVVLWSGGGGLEPPAGCRYLLGRLARSATRGFVCPPSPAVWTSSTLSSTTTETGTSTGSRTWAASTG